MMKNTENLRRESDTLQREWEVKKLRTEELAMRYFEAAVQDKNAENYDRAALRRLKLDLFSQMLSLFHDIKKFKSLWKYRTWKIYGKYEHGEEWMYDIYISSVERAMKTYDTSKGKGFLNYVIVRYSWDMKDAAEKIENEQSFWDYHAAEYQEMGESSGSSSDGETETSRKSMNQMRYADRVEEQLRLQWISDWHIMNLMRIITAFYKKKKDYSKMTEKISRNSAVSKQDYFQWFYTEYLIKFIQDCGSIEGALSYNHETEAIEIADEKWMDYILEQKCRKFDRIAVTQLRTFDAILQNDNKNRLRIPVKAEIYQYYMRDILSMMRSLGSVKASVSKYRTIFDGQLDELKNRKPEELF